MLASLMVASGLVTLGISQATVAGAATSCESANAIVCENSKPGTPASVWDVSGEGDQSILGFATDMSVDAGATESFKIKTSASYTIDVYRLGYYQGNGARLITSLTPTARTQPACKTETSTHLIDCGNWSVSASWAVPSTAVSGVYIARLTRTDTKGASQIPFVVRNDSSSSAVLFQTSDTSWQAYNNYGGDTFFNNGANFYGGPQYDSNNRAYKLSYNRPFITRGWEGGRDYLFSNEYPMIRFLESNGYDVSYFSGLDTDRYGSLLTNHKVFLTAGHDEYWSGTQRANVEAARDAGVNLAFFSGNDNYWKTRYESSTASTDDSLVTGRTLVCYKDTWAQAHIDPTSAWTGTWRDPRFSPPLDGGKPENALSGTIFMSNATDLPLTVNSDEGKLRIWRKTSLTSMSAGTSTALAPHTVGYETNEDVDNGFRPAGLIDMSTTTGASDSYLQDYGTATAKGTTTHHITLYKASSGALVFSAGSVQWAWGLDSQHDGIETAADSRIQQATVNLLADMGVQPSSLISGLTAVTKSGDTVAPTSTITSPAAGTSIANGSKVTATGTATDAGGGVVGGVEISVDGGATWHPVSGRGNWSYSFIAHGSGQVTLKTRAADDSGNIEDPSAGVTVTETCPCTLYGSATPKLADADDASDVELGVKFQPNVNGFVNGVRFYKASANTGSHTGTLWSSSGSRLATGTFTDETASGWQTLTFSTPVQVKSGTTYVVSYRAPKGHYSADTNFFTAQAWVAGPLTGLRATSGSGNGVYANGGAFPNTTYSNENYYVDAVFDTVNTAPPAVNGSSPRNQQTGVSTDSSVSATFTAPVTAGSVKIVVKDASGSSVAGTTSYDADSQTATFAPGARLATSTTYTVTVSGATSSAGVTMTATSWSFSTDSSASCPCSLFGSTSKPASVDAGDGSSVEAGVRVTPAVSGYVTGVRFYKASSNTGTHTGTLWSASGSVLATGTFSNETASGWQTLTFSSPVAVTAGTTYTASYLAPNGHYAADGGFFSTPFRSGQLSSPAGSNGVFAYGKGSTLPASSYNSTNYWVDVLFQDGSTPPGVASTSPASGATGVGIGSVVSASFTSATQSGSAKLVLTDKAGATVSGTTTTISDGTKISFSPDRALATSTTYTATVSGATNAFGVTMSAPVSWSFTTADPVACPCSLFSGTSAPTTADGGDGSSVEVGVRVTPAVSGYVTGVRFYKASSNTGTHTGTLWSASGSVLATGTFSNETASGWQTLTFSSPVAVTAGTTYTASYLAPNGHYSADGAFFASTYSSGYLVAPSSDGNGVYVYSRGGGKAPTSSYNATNYWVDLVFTTSSAAPTVASTSPASDATGVGVGSIPSATFSLAVQAGSAQLSVTGPGGSAVTGTSTQNAGNTQVSFTPSAPLAQGVTYTAKVSGATNSDGVAMTPISWSFTTEPAKDCPCSLFSGTSAPTTADGGDGSSVEVGVRVTPAVSGYVTGVRFYKASSNTGTHTGTLWSASGSVLATGTFSNETASGWQTLTFSSPVAVTAGTTYTASYLAPNGHFARDGAFFTSPYSSGPLVAPSSGGNGVYVYGAGNTLPANSYNASNYWVDVVFTTTTPTPTPTPTPSASANPSATPTPTATPAPAPTVTAISPAADATDVPVGSAATATFSSTLDSSTIVASVTPSGGSAVSSTVSYDAASKTVKIAPAAALAMSTKYTVSITAKDTAGTSMADAKTWSFTTVDPPAITAVTATGAGTSQTITWTTDKASSSVVQYGTSPTALTSTANGPTSITAHAVTLTRLSPETLYYYRVTSADAASNSATSPAASGAAASFVPAKNLAQGGAATQSSDALGGVASRAVDGNTDGVWANNSVTHTNEDAQAWWQVDLGSSVAINSVIVWNRTDCCAERLNGAVVFISAASMSGRSYSDLQADDSVTKLSVGTPTAASTVLAAGKATGRYVKVQLPGTKNLSLAEVQVTGTVIPTVTAVSPAAGATGVATTVVPSASFSVAVDPATIVASITPSGGSAVSSTVSYDSASKTATVTPAAALDYAKSYTVSITAKDTNGTAMTSAKAWSFTTLNAPPTVTAFAPAANATNVAAGVAVTATFSSAVDPATIVASVTPAGGSAISSSVSYDAASRTAKVTPAAALASAKSYTVSITAKDTSGTAMTTAKTWSFTTADTVPPVVTVVSATGSGTSATVTWTTDEDSSSTVQYGTAANALSSSATAAGNVKSHSVALTGLTVNTRYYYRVVSADVAGNSATSPATAAAAAEYVPTVTPIKQTTAADFNTGANSSTYVGGRDGGEIVIAPSGLTQEFEGATAPSSWTGTSLASGSSVAVAGGLATVSGQFFRTSSTYSYQRELDAVLTLKPVNNQWWGMTNGDYTSAGSSWVAFHTTSTGGLVAESHVGNFFGLTSSTYRSTTTLAGSYLGGPHRFEIDNSGSTITYSIDGTVVATHSKGITASMNVAARDATVDANPMVLDSVWLTPYASSGTWTSAVVDAGASVKWGTFTPTATTPSGTGITYQYRTAATTSALNSASWSPVNPGSSLAATNRYLQYRAVLTTGTSGSAAARTVTPTVTAVSVDYSVS